MSSQRFHFTLKVNTLKKVYLTSLGCKVNQYEIQLLREQFEALGCSIVSQPVAAEICVINTCSVTCNSDRRSKKAIEKIMRLNPQAEVIVCGCCVDNEYSSVNSISGPKCFVPNKDKQNIPSLLGLNVDNSINGITSFFGKGRGFVKIQDGCDNYCSYCIVAYTRGDAQSRSQDDILKEIKQLTANGYREIVLTGINIGYYGKDTSSSLAGLLRKATAIKNLGRLRLSSLNPDDIDLNLIKVVKNSQKICKHFHISVQSADTRILKLMNRKYTGEYLVKTLQTIKKEIPSVSFSGDFICGFPQETDNNFKKTLKLINDFDFIRSHIFTYSDRKKTAAYNFKSKVSDKIKKERSKVLKDASYGAASRYINKFINQELEVLIEYKPDPKTGMHRGYSGNYIKTLVENLPMNFRGQLIKVKVLKIIENQVISCPKIL